VFYSLQLFFKYTQVIFIISGDVADGVFAGYHTMIFMDGAAVDAVHTEQFELVFAVKCHEIVMDQTFLRQFVLVGYTI
jgi:predicted butyrate kinase (DUF1464 family)